MHESERSLDNLYASSPSWVTAHISMSDAKLMEKVIATGLTGPVVEVGVASGWSSAVLLSLLRRNPPKSRDDIWLHSFDIAEWCYFDPCRRVGSAVAEVVPELQKHWRVRTGISVDAGSLLGGIGAAMAFIDGDHFHPWPTIDLIALLPALAPNARVVLHDTNLPMGSEAEGWKVSGAKYLFERWKWAKETSGGENPNSGVIQLPGDHQKVRELCDDILRERWDVPIQDKVLRAVGLTWKDGYWVEPTPEFLLACVNSAAASGRPLMLWGAGNAGTRFLQASGEFGVRFTSFIDSSPQKQNALIAGLLVLPPERLNAIHPRPFVLITSQFATEIVQALELIGFRRDADYMIAPLAWPGSR